MSGDDDFDEAEESTAIFNAAELASIPPKVQDRHVLVRMDGSDVGKIVNLPRGEYSIGRRPTADLVLNYDGVSRRHARIVFKEGAYYLEDLGSSNGTAIAGKKIKTHLLKDGDIIQFGPHVSVRYSVTDFKEERMLRHLYEASVRDSLTGAFNREYLRERLNAEIAYCERHRSETSLILFDLDHFKKVNDTYGHQAGDTVLVEVSKVVRDTLRTEDVFARYGGEEFGISLRGIDLPNATQLAERIRKINNRVVRYEEKEIPISISIGVASLNCCEPHTAEELIAVADRRLYAAKRAGRNRVVSEG